MRYDRTFEPEATSVGAVRSFVQSSLESAGADEQSVADVVLLSSELASNVVDHARTPYTVSLVITGDLARVEIRDGSSVLPAVRDLSESPQDRGRGLRILSTVAMEWGVTSLDTGKAVWFVAPL
jgi:anti-sigma regulatory factor (Ser/Thr protein kinase)